ncbi:MAG: hypothetical protein HY901_12785 [Deltaproteobacteria bacterium]|nr:hypothetical protein [Deltaproteobacteria bacterium]
MAVYLATSQPVPTKDRSPLSIEPTAPESAARLRQHFTLEHLYYVASHEGCGCGFITDQDQGTDEDCADRAASLSALHELVHETALLTPGAQLLVCFDGEEETAPEHSRTLEDPDQLRVRWGDRILYSVLVRR